MKNIYIIQNSNLSFDMDISKLFAPEKYFLFLIINNFGFQKLRDRKQEKYFSKIWITENFDFSYLQEIISNNQKNDQLPLQIVTNAEEAIAVSGELRLFFKIDVLNYERFKNKLLMKELLEQHDFLIPKHFLFDKELYGNNPSNFVNCLIKTLTFPLIAKPIDAMGCINIQKINSIEELTSWCIKAYTNESIYEIDEFIDGKVYNCDSYIKNNKIIFTQISECSNSCFDFINGLTKGTIALPHDDPTYKFLCDYTAGVHDAIHIPQGGVTHLEVILTKNKRLYFIEIGHRSPGILIPAMYKKFLDINTIESHILLQIDDDYQFNINFGPYCAWIAFPKKNGVLKNKYFPEIQSKYKLEWFNEIGDKMSNVQCGRDYVGRLLVWNNDYQQLQKDFTYLNSYQFYDIESPHNVLVEM